MGSASRSAKLDISLQPLHEKSLNFSGLSHSLKSKIKYYLEMENLETKLNASYTVQKRQMKKKMPNNKSSKSQKFLT